MWDGKAMPRAETDRHSASEEHNNIKPWLEQPREAWADSSLCPVVIACLQATTPLAHQQQGKIVLSM